MDRHRSKLLAFDFTLVYEPGQKNPCDYASRHPEPIPDLEDMTDAMKEELGIESEREDSTLSVNSVIMEGNNAVITKEQIVKETRKDVSLSQVLEDVRRGRISENVRSGRHTVRSLKNCLLLMVSCLKVTEL